ncbi:MAG: CHAD domain-containing protein [bacterium]|nr:CHAD domain-containing protein [bacterium]
MDKAAVELLDKSTRERTRTLRTQVKRCRKQFSEEAVHDLRVAMRRLLALTDFLAFLAPSPALRKVRRDIKGHLDAFDTLRDTQVMLLETSQRVSELPEMEPFHLFLQKREKRLLRSAQKDINAIKNGYSKPLRATLKSIAQGNIDALAPVDDAYQTVLHRLALIDPTNTATIHRVRIAFKRFRYSVEVVKPLLTTMPEQLLARLHDYQTLMGEIQDMEVMLRAIDEFAAKNQQCMMEPVRQFYQQRHAERVSAYIQRMNEVYSFWRAAPDRALPWEAASIVEPAAEAEEPATENAAGEALEPEHVEEAAEAQVDEVQTAAEVDEPVTDNSSHEGTPVESTNASPEEDSA